MNWLLLLSLIAVSLSLRPSSVPLIVMNPYISIWSPHDHLYDGWTYHWAGGIYAMYSSIRVDGQCYKLMGGQNIDKCPNAQQLSVEVRPTQTIYVMKAGGVNVQMTFMTPRTVEKIEDMALPIAYIRYTIRHNDGNTHDVKIFYDNSAEVCSDDKFSQVDWEHVSIPGQVVMKIGVTEQYPLKHRHDEIGWGYWYAGTKDVEGLSANVAFADKNRESFASSGTILKNDTDKPRSINDEWPATTIMWDVGTIGLKAVTRTVHIVFDEIDAIKYYGTVMKPYWTRMFSSTEKLLEHTAREEENYFNSTEVYDANLRTKLRGTGGDKYCDLASLAYRQAIGATNVVWNQVKNRYWVFLKEISSNGDLQTVDVVFPAAPFFLFLAPMRLWELMEPVMVHANNGSHEYGLDIKYNLAWAPHHIGVYPIGDLRPSQQENMPVEETANLFMMIADIVAQTDSHDFLDDYWQLLRNWGQYLESVLPDPGDQLCTDDFMGPSPHNSNLAVKGIVGLGALSQILAHHGETELSKHYMDTAHKYAQTWKELSLDPVGKDHYKLRYDQSNTWSMKYNLYFEKVLGLDLFGDSVIQTEMEYYLKNHMNKYGIPLDVRASFTKGDWEMWLAALGTNEQFREITSSYWTFINETPTRYALPDWFETVAGTSKGFRNRPVVGGIYAKSRLEKH